MDTVRDYEWLGLGYAVHQDRPSARRRSDNDESVPPHEIQRFKLPCIDKSEFMVTGPLGFLRGAIHGMVHDGKVLRDNHDALAVLGSLYDPATQHDFDSRI